MTSSENEFSWNIISVISEHVQCDERSVGNVVRLLDDDNTIPFIARYRKEQTNFMEPDKLREIKDEISKLRELRAKVCSLSTKVEKLGKLDTKLKSAFCACQTLEDVEHLYAPFKPGSKRTLAERARQLGLDEVLHTLLTTASATCLVDAVNAKVEGLSSLSEVEQGVQHVLADIMAKDIDIISATRQRCRSGVSLLSKQVKTAKSTTTTSGKKSSGSSTKVSKACGKTGNVDKAAGKAVDAHKFELYFDFKAYINAIKPHQVLAINRGESLKVLRVSVDVPNAVKDNFVRRCVSRYEPRHCDGHVTQLIARCAVDAYDRLVQPMLTRGFRAELTKKAEKASVTVFASNLKQLLLTPPIRGKSILGIDPGFHNGCKFAVISATGSVLEAGVAYLHKRDARTSDEMHKIKSALLKYRCETVAIGNGVGCRETEKLMSDTIQRRFFAPLSVMFCIVSESGASIYSASEDAQRELPDYDVSLRGAVSIARRLQDPLAELIKIDPKNIGVGMYQHDVSEKELKSALDGVVEDAVAVVGADLNVASETLLRHISGIGDKMARKIVERRLADGPFICRSQLLCIAGLGSKTFEQSAGFLRIMPRSNIDDTERPVESQQSTGKRKQLTSVGPKQTKKRKLDTVPNPLDATWIHPESYELADNVLSAAKLDKQLIGQMMFTEQLKRYVNSIDVATVAKSFDVTDSLLRQILDGLMQPVNFDVRDHYRKPLFRRGVTSLSDTRVGEHLTGSVTNVTHFGAFVDVGVSHDGLIHSSAISAQLLPSGRQSLEIGDHVEVCVRSVDVDRHRLGLSLVRLLIS